MTRWVAALMALLGVALFAVVPMLAPRVAMPPGYSQWQNELPSLAVMTATVGVGAFLAWKRPRNPIGWLLAGAGLGFLAFPASVVGAAAGGPALVWVGWV